jgi:DNA-binding response OmpR family regulator
VAKILLVEDDTGLSRMVRDWLTFEHHLVETADNGRDGLDKLQFYQYDLVILDWELPEMTGIQICKEFRSRGGTTPVLMLTGKGTIGDKESGYDAGADDYLTKPFHMKELSLRLRALLRRGGTALQSDTLKFRDLELEPGSHRVTRQGKDLQLLPKEFALLEFLMRHPNQVFSAEALLSRVWASETDTTVDAVSTCIKRLRKKIDVDGQNSIIKTVHGVGYKLESE